LKMLSGATCSGSQTAGSACSVVVSFAPGWFRCGSAPGIREKPATQAGITDHIWDSAKQLVWCDQNLFRRDSNMT
jgi:hypothetical protein